MGSEDQYMDIVKNNALHISNVVMHTLMMGIHTWLPVPPVRPSGLQEGAQRAPPGDQPVQDGDGA